MLRSRSRVKVKINPTFWPLIIGWVIVNNELSRPMNFAYILKTGCVVFHDSTHGGRSGRADESQHAESWKTHSLKGDKIFGFLSILWRSLCNLSL